jgi:hypothetical protein
MKTLVNRERKRIDAIEQAKEIDLSGLAVDGAGLKELY